MKTNENLLIDKSSSIILFNSELYQHELIRSQITYLLTDKLQKKEVVVLFCSFDITASTTKSGHFFNFNHRTMFL